ncbi:hypothetical protein AAEU28_03215 [Pseudoalteromonas sp. SS15]|uniref:hypothetical protein n=1 Tax=Pseudoalteromonas sp. SS15 TaxID=3139393 RepID=UPI003BA896AD
MELNRQQLKLIKGGLPTHGDDSPKLPEKKKSQSVETDSFSSSLTAEPVKLSELPKP